MKSVIVQNIRSTRNLPDLGNGKKGKGKILGIMVCEKFSEGTFGIGFSLCNKKDTFNRELGLAIAHKRAVFHAENAVSSFIPFTAVNSVHEFMIRCAKYFHVDSQVAFGELVETTTEDVFGDEITKFYLKK